MDTTFIFENIGRHITLSETEENFFLSLLNEKPLKKKDLLIKEGEISTFTSFVTAGCLRSYSVDTNGFEHIVQFAPPGWWIADISSLITKQPGKLCIEALENSELLMLRREDQEKLFEKIPKFERFFTILTENSIAAHHLRLMDYMGLTASERYDSFCKRYPGLIRSLPQKQIAAYIGVTPEFLSKMKSELLRRK